MDYAIINTYITTKRKKVTFFILVTLCALNYSFAQFEIPEQPKFQTSVYDYANLLSAPQKTA